ncbi:DNA polymerase lambda [Pholiota molesta]|nr:DNA polymerase lambda [Pholiota molesta]
MLGAAHHNDDSSIIYISSSPSSRASSPGPTEVSASKKQGVKGKSAKLAVEKRLPKGKKEKPQPMTPAEYARSLKSKPVDAGISASGPPLARRKSTGSKVLAGKNIFYIGGDMRHASETTRGRMDIIVKHGGNLMPEYDPEVTTHIIAEAHAGPTLRALNLRSLKQIPNHIPTVKWPWVLTAMDVQSCSQDEIDRKLGDYSRYAAFVERIHAGCEVSVAKSVPTFRSKGKERALGERPGEASTQPGPSNLTPPVGALPSPPTSPVRPIERSKARERESSRAPSAQDNHKDSGDINDPLAEFYQQAKLLSQNDDGSGAEEEGTDDDEGVPDSVRQMPKQKRGWTCDKKEPERKGDCPNQDIIDKLSELMKLHKVKMGDDDHWRAFSYSKSIRALRNYPRRIKSYEEARGITGVGEKTAQKIQEILETGELQRIKYETTKDVEVTRLFQGIYGVGQHIAFQWYSAGCRTLEDLKSGKGGVKLNHVQEIGLRFYDDINDRMPRAEAKAIFDLIKPIALSIDPRLFVEIMGSYRRGKADCGDIDILITRPIDDGKTHKGVMSRILQKLHAAHILTEDLALPEDPYDLECTYRGLCRLPDVPGSRRRRIDILSIPWTSRGAALLYYTGDDIFNRAIRMKANVLGYSLNQKGLFGSVVRDPRDRRIKMNDGVLVASETEEEIFKILGVPWQEPHERVRG